jgi:hypothetical protein
VISFPRHHGSILSDFQKVALCGFRNDPKFDLREHVTISTAELVEPYFGLFENFFFLASLKDCCELSIDGDDTHRRGEVIEKELKRKIVLGFLSREQEEKCIIVVSSQPDEFEGRYEKMKAYVAMLLHVMIHAFQELWTFGHSSCRDGFEKLGRTGHGRVWQDVALAEGGGEGWRGFEFVFKVGEGVCCGGGNEGVCKKGGFGVMGHAT